MPDNNPTEGFSFWITVAFTLNYILGSGFLTLPWTFSQTGVFLGITVLAVFGFFSILSVFFILETIDRGKRLQKYALETGIELATIYSLGTKSTYSQIGDSSYHNPESGTVDEEELSSKDTEIINPISTTSSKLNKLALVHPNDLINGKLENTKAGPGCAENSNDKKRKNSAEVVNQRKLELVELSGMFLGVWGQQTYAAIIILYMYGTLWAYCVVFAKAFAAHLPIFASSYSLYVLIFGLIVVPGSLMEFKEQVSVQVALSIFRIVMVSVMVITCLIASFRGDNEFSSERDVSNAADNPLTKFSPENMYYLLPVAAYAYIFHHSVPSLADNSKDEKHLSHLFRTALVISIVAYSLVGAVVAVHFGSSIETTSNLNWGHYRGPHSSTADSNDISIGASIVSFFVVLFPAIDVASAFPLNAFTLGNNLMSLYYGSDMHKHESSRWKLNMFRALAAVPPIFGGLLSSKIEQITAYTGLSAFGLAFVLPPVLARYSALKLAAIGLPVSTPHSSFWTSEFFQWLLFVSGIVFFIVVLVCLLVMSK